MGVNMNMIIALINAFSLVVQFSICVIEVLNSILGMPLFIYLSKTCLSSVLKTWFLHEFQHGSMTLNAPLSTNSDERCVSSICRIVNGFMNSKNIVELLSSILGQPYLNCLEKGCLRSVCENVINLQI